LPVPLVVIAPVGERQQPKASAALAAVAAVNVKRDDGTRAPDVPYLVVHLHVDGVGFDVECDAVAAEAAVVFKRDGGS